MKLIGGLLAALLITAPSITFFKHQRPVQATESGGQHYVVLDETLWPHASPDLKDMRLYREEAEVPFKLEIERGGSETERKECRVLQPATVEGKTQFLLDMSGIAEYDRVGLRLAGRNFVARASVEGQDDPHGSRWAALGTTTLYDLSAERLGSNSTLQLPPTTYRYLRVSVDGGVQPSEVQGAAAGITREREAVWRTVGGGSTQVQQGRETVLEFTVAANVPVERVVFEIDPAQPNFRRQVEMQGVQGQPLQSSEISRVHMQRGGRRIDAELTSIEFRGTGQTTLRAVIYNGDDLPLKITGARLEQYERRIYFESAAGSQHSLYYGDELLDPPVYDYARFFQKDGQAMPARLGSEVSNTRYTGRPDERPWSERHPAVLWVALIATVLILGGLAVRSMRNTAPRDA